MKHGRTIGERWHEEAVENGKRDAFALVFAVIVIWVGLLIAGVIYSGWTHDRALAEEARAEEARLARVEEEYRIFRDTQEHEAQKKQWSSIKLNLDTFREKQRIAEEMAAAEAQQQAEMEYYYYEPVYYSAPYDTSDGISAAEFQWMGVVEEDGVRYTWYSQNVLPGGGLNELNANGRHVENGFVVDGDGYIAVASSDYAMGTVVDTPFGEAKVYDTGCASGTIDVYTNF